MSAERIRNALYKIHPLVLITSLYFGFWLFVFNLGRLIFILYQQ
jgi:hypothetical protein